MSSIVKPEETSPVKQGFAAGTTFAAAILLFVAAFVSLLQGIAAVAKDDLFVVGVQYVYKMNLTGWGWIHIAIGVFGLAVAVGMMMGAAWARMLGMVFAGISIIANFLWLPEYPLWAIVVIAIDVVVIWALATWDPAE